MANTSPAPDAVDPVVKVASITEPGPEPITLDEFCQRHSKADRRVEMLGGFYASQKSEGNIKALESEFAERFQAFATKPV